MSVASAPFPGSPAPAPQSPPGNASVLSRLAETHRPVNWMEFLLTTGVSLFFHVVIIGLCTFIVFDEKLQEEIFTTIMPVKEVENEPITEQSPIVATDLSEPPPDSVSQNTAAEVVQQNSAEVTLDVNDLDPSTMITDVDSTASLNVKIGDHIGGRSQAARAQLVQKFGGNTSSEMAVNGGMKWLSKHVHQTGGWSFDHRCPDCDDTCSQTGSMPHAKTAATGLALLTFLGGGHTHMKGDFQKEVKQGLEFLVKTGKPTADGLDLRGEVKSHEGMYAHAIATLALCEAVALSKDKRYMPAAQGAIKYIINAQDPKGGGWRYNPKQPGDTSVVGWQVMALKSAQLANIKVPSLTFKGAENFLNSVQEDGGANYGYDKKEKGRRTTTSVGLLCRMYMGWDQKTKAMERGVKFLDAQKPAPNDMYYNYYATQVLHHWGGDEWTRWNNVMRDQLVKSQVRNGHATGSWNLADGHGGAGGRLYMTCLATMTLEVYYRHLPIYSREKLKVNF